VADSCKLLKTFAILIGIYNSHVLPIQVQCVIVLYKNTPAESKTIQSIVNCCKRRSDLAEQLSILIYDNSPYPQQTSPTNLPFLATEYRHDGQNGGLVAAYNYALRRAQQRKISWLIVLDQDTVVEDCFFPALLKELVALSTPNVCAVVPKLTRDGVMLSPQVVGKFWNKSIPFEFSGISDKHLTALNSAACLRIDALVKIGGFPLEYRLDYLDHVIFHRLQSAGGRIVVLDVTIQHCLSSMNLEAEMSIERYVSMLSAEWSFVKETEWGGGTLVHRLRLWKRAVVLFVKVRNRRYALQTLKYSLR
ncbi:glycosyltransferase, partial [Tunturiibacter gelidiferens]|uniref:glycosyltransferase n=1 Tax=Tunturiibacter gelidiferens TaxID=3069689 RepID=UPI003D9BD6F0